MSKYNQTTNEAVSWTRCCEVYISNELEQVPTIRFNEQKVVTIGGETLKQYAQFCGHTFNPQELIQILDIETGEPTGELIPHYKLYQIIYSLYIGVAKARDQGIKYTGINPPIFDTSE